MEFVDEIGKWLLLAWLGYCIFVGLREVISNFGVRQNRTIASAEVKKPTPTKVDPSNPEHISYKNAHRLPCEASVAGVSFPNKDNSSRQEILATIRLGSILTLEREPNNQFDQNAIKVNSASGCIGYLPKTLASQFTNTEIDSLEVQLIKKGKTDSNIYWAKIRIGISETSSIKLTPAAEPNSATLIEPIENISADKTGQEATTTVDQNFIEIDGGISFPDQTPLPGRGLTGHIRLKRTYLPYSFLSPHKDWLCMDLQPFKDQELLEILICCIQKEMAHLTNSDYWPIQSLDQTAYECWSKKLQNYSKALRLCKEDTTIGEIWDVSDSLNLYKAATFMLELQEIQRHTIVEEIKGYSVNGLFQGVVEITSSNSPSHFKGVYVDGMKNGKGVEITPEGDIYEGDFLNNLRCGTGTLRQGKKSLSGTFINGKHYGEMSFNNFQPPEFWIGYHINLKKIMFVPRDLPKGARSTALYAIFPETWETIEITLAEMGTPLRKHIKNLSPSEQAEIEKTLESWKEEFKNNTFIKIYSKIYPSYLSGNKETHNIEYTNAMLNEFIEKNTAFSNLTRDEKIKKLQDLIYVDQEYCNGNPDFWIN